MLNRFEGVLAGILLVIAVFLILSEIVLRTVFSYSLIGISGIASLLVIWSVFFGASYGIMRNLHVRVDLLQYALPEKIGAALDIVVTLICLCVSALLGYSGFLLIQESLMLGETTMGFIRIPVWLVQLVMPLAGGLFCLRLLQRLWLQVGVSIGRISATEKMESTNVGST